MITRMSELIPRIFLFKYMQCHFCVNNATHIDYKDTETLKKFLDSYARIGRKRTTGSQVSQWDNVVATLPDLTQMESIAYANEIDVRRVAVGQSVEITPSRESPIQCGLA